jgi:hypothetical protein
MAQDPLFREDLVLKNFRCRSNIVVAMPLNDDDVLTIDLVFYSSASSSNINPYDAANSTPWQAHQVRHKAINLHQL